MPTKNLRDAMVQELQDMLHAERQIAAALPKMAEKATNPQLKETLQEHVGQTEGQIHRLEQAFQAMGVEPKARECEGIHGILEEGEGFMKDDVDHAAMNAMLIAAAQKVEHYEMASYGTLRSWAEWLQNQEAAELMRQNLEEEKQTDMKLTQLAERMINPGARD